MEQKPILVTGASGFVGWHVARLLLEQGAVVHALVRPGREVPGLPVRLFEGDLRDARSVQQAILGCGAVFHVAADYRLWVKDADAMFETNVRGTSQLLELASIEEVGRFVYTSTVGCIGIPDDGLGDETTPVDIQAMHGIYKQSKYLAEEAVLRMASQGFPAVIVNPTAPVGVRDAKPTPTGQLIVDFLRGRMPAYLDTGLNIVDVEDVALGHLLACEYGRPGDRYILGGENLTLQEILDTLSDLSGRPAPRIRIPYGVAMGFARLSTAWAGVTGNAPRAPIDAVRMARKKMFVSSGKAERELGYRPCAAREALSRAVGWYRENGYV
ncbi:MAG: NAD-dependent epimerase/dehydratase family protein [Bryobacterales bacterium]|nr:NAD-dependent epimerase/dehydratase family protein [Bryobacterales bacterium]